MAEEKKKAGVFKKVFYFIIFLAVVVGALEVYSKASDKPQFSVVGRIKALSN